MSRNGNWMKGAGCAAVLALGVTNAQTEHPASNCPPLVCVSRTDDDASAPKPGMLRYAIVNAPDNAVITFDPSITGQTVTLDGRGPGNQIKLTRNVCIQGPGPNQLTISGGHTTRIFFVSGATVEISGLTLTGGIAAGGDGGPGSGGSGGGGGAAGLGGAIFVNSGSLTLSQVTLTGNRCSGGNGGAGGSGFGVGRGGGGGGFGGPSAHGPLGGAPGDLTANGTAEGSGGIGGNAESFAEPGGEGGWAGGGGGGGFSAHTGVGRGAPGGAGGFAGGVGGGGAFLDAEGGAIAAGGGTGGSALGGAVFVRSGRLVLHDAAFINNAAVGGLGGSGTPNGVAKGGALFVCSSYYCGPGHDGTAAAYGKTFFSSSTAAQAGEDPACSGRDDRDVCGMLKTVENESKQ
jgi:hypothetical protein